MVGDRAPDIIAGADVRIADGPAGGAMPAARSGRRSLARDLRATFEGRDLRDFATYLRSCCPPDGASRWLQRPQTLSFFSSVRRRAGLWRSKCLKYPVKPSSRPATTVATASSP